MSKDANGANLLLGKGKVYFDRFTSAGAATGERFLGNCERFEITTTDERVQKHSSAEAAAPLLASAVTRRTPEVAITLDEFTKENIALVLMGDESALAQSADSVTDEAHNGVKQGRYYKLAYRNVSSVVVTGEGGTPTYVLNTDYEVDAVTGRIYIVPDGSITDDTNVLVSYDYAADTSAYVKGGSASKIEGSMRFKPDPSAGPKWEVEIWKVSISPDGALALIGEDYANAPLKAEILADSTNHPTEPLYRAIKIT